MHTTLLALATVFLFIAGPCVSVAEPLKTYVSEFSVTGTPDREELKLTLQGILASRLNPDQTQLVESADRAELLLTGSYALFGKNFSLDISIKLPASGKLSKVYEQGEGQDDLLPAVGRLTRKIERELTRIRMTVPAAAIASPPKAPVEASGAGLKTAAPPATPVPGYIVKSGNPIPSDSAITPLEGVFGTIALGRTLPTGERELFVAGERSIRFLVSGAGVKQKAEVVIPIPARILAIDTADLDSDGTPELYVTILDRESLSSRVYLPTESGLVLLADNLPWFFRGIGSNLKSRIINVQGMDSDGKYFGGISELLKSGNRFEARNPRKLPPQGNIFNCTSFRDASGAELTAILDEDGYLSVYGINGNKLWKSSDKYGGSETSFKHESLTQLRSTGDQYHWTFIEQRIIVLPDGTLLVPRNEGIFSVGNSRSFNKHTLHALKWNGALLNEIWHARQSPSYLSDFAYDHSSGEVILLEVLQKADLFSKGKTAITINRIE